MGRQVLVIGPGAVGSFLGATLAMAGHGVTLLGRSPAPGAAAPGTAHDAAEARLVLEDARPGPGRTRRREVPVRRVPDASAAPDPDIVLLAVKAFDLPGALEAAARWPEVPVVTVQNGVGAEEMASEARPSPVIAASLTVAVEPVPGGVRRLRTGGLGLAAARGPAALAEDLAAAFRAGDLPVRVLQDAAAMKWSKLLANLVGNATSALLDLDPGTIYRDPVLYRLERRQLLEAVDVMHALGLRPVGLPGAHVLMLLRGLRLPDAMARPVIARAIAGARGGKSPSLRLHLRGGGRGPGEVAWLNGAVDRAGRVAGCPAPVNARLAELVEEAARNPARAAWLRARPDRLLEAMGSARPGS